MGGGHVQSGGGITEGESTGRQRKYFTDFKSENSENKKPSFKPSFLKNVVQVSYKAKKYRNNAGKQTGF